MGAFYGSIQVKSEDRDNILMVSSRVAAEMNIRLLVGPVINGWVGIYPENNGQDERVSERFATQLSEPLLHLLVHDDDIFAYWFFRDGSLVDSYHSTPGYFGEENRASEEQRVGKPEAFRFLIEEKVKRLAPLLDRGKTPPVASETLIAFAKLLKITNAAQAYEYLKSDERSGVKGWRQFVEIPAEATVDEKEHNRQRQTALRIELARLKAEEKLLFIETRKDCSPLVCALKDKFFVAWPEYRAGTASFAEYASPWKKRVDVHPDVPAHITAVATDHSASRAAMAARDRVRVWAVDSDPWTLIDDVPERDLPVSAALSPDGLLVAHASRQEVVITSLADRRQLCSFRPGGHRQIAFHPSQKFVVFAAMAGLGVVRLEPEPTWHQLIVGGLVDGISARLAGAVRAKFLSIDTSDVVGKTASAIEKATTQLRAISARAKQPVTDQEIEDLRQNVSAQVAAWADRINAAKNGDISPLFPRQPKERPHCVGFSRSGKWFWCGTDKGLSVYNADEMLIADGVRLPEPTWRFNSPGELKTDSSHQVMAVAEEVDEAAIVFGTGGGYLCRMSLDSGISHELIKIPGEAHVWGLSLSRRGDTLAVTSFSAPEPRTRSLQHSTLHIWSYPTLLAGRA